MTEEEGIRSPLHDQQVAQGAEFYWEDGWPWALKFAEDPVPEYEAIRTSTGIWDLFSTCKYEVTGPDAGELVQRRFTNDVSAMQPGSVRYGAFVNPDGKMVDDGNVYKHSDQKYWALINTADIEDWFRETASGLNASVEHRTTQLPMISVQGPRSRETLAGLTDAPLEDLKYFRFLPDPVKVAGQQAWLLRTGFSGELGYELVTDNDEAIRSLWDSLSQGGAKPFGLDAIEMARVEAGLIIIGVDYQVGATSPWDMSMDRFIKANTGCVGSEALAAYASGGAPRRLKTLSFSGEAPEAGTAVTRDGAEVGTITSPQTTPRFGAIGLAVLDRAAAVDGAELDVAGSTATVQPLSILDPQKQRPRA